MASPRSSDPHARIAELEAELRVVKGMLEECVQKRIQAEVAASTVRTASSAVPSLVRSVSDMTTKQRAVLFAILAGQQYASIADAMQVSATTVKLHFKAALDKLGYANKSALMVEKNSVLGEIKSAKLETNFSMPLDWVDSRPSNLMAELGRTRTTIPPPRERVVSRKKK